MTDRCRPFERAAASGRSPRRGRRAPAAESRAPLRKKPSCTTSPESTGHRSKPFLAVEPSSSPGSSWSFSLTWRPARAAAVPLSKGHHPWGTACDSCVPGIQGDTASSRPGIRNAMMEPRAAAPGRPKDVRQATYPNGQVSSPGEVRFNERVAGIATSAHNSNQPPATASIFRRRPRSWSAECVE